MTSTARSCCLSCPNSMGLIRLTRFLSGLLYCQQAACPAVELCTKHRGLFSCSFLLGTAIIASRILAVNEKNAMCAEVSCYHDSFTTKCKFFMNTPIQTSDFQSSSRSGRDRYPEHFCSLGLGAGASTSRKTHPIRSSGSGDFSCLWVHKHCLQVAN